MADKKSYKEFTPEEMALFLNQSSFFSEVVPDDQVTYFKYKDSEYMIISYDESDENLHFYSIWTTDGEIVAKHPDSINTLITNFLETN